MTRKKSGGDNRTREFGSGYQQFMDQIATRGGKGAVTIYIVRPDNFFKVLAEGLLRGKISRDTQAITYLTTTFLNRCKPGAETPKCLICARTTFARQTPGAVVIILPLLGAEDGTMSIVSGVCWKCAEATDDSIKGVVMREFDAVDLDNVHQHDSIQ